MEPPYWNRINPYNGYPWSINHLAEKSNHVAKSVIAGALGSSIQICIVYPTEYVKIQLQLDTAHKKLYHGTIDCIRKTIQNHGFRGLYGGLTINVCNGTARAAVRFGTWEYIKSMFLDQNGHLSKSGKLFAGMAAGVIEAIFVDIPTETIKTKIVKDFRLKTPQYKGLIDATRIIVKEEGIRGLFRGAIPTIWSLGVSQSVRFFIIDTLTDVYKGNDSHKVVPNAYVGFSAAVAGLVSVIVTQPLDVMKTRLQGDTESVPVLTKILRIWKNEGIRGYYRGTVPRLGTRVFGLAITFMLYDAILKTLDKIWIVEDVESKK